MDIYGYSQIEDLKELLDINNIEIARLRGIRLMREQSAVPLNDINEAVEKMKLYNAVQWLRQRAWDYWCSWRSERKHPAFIYKKVYDVHDMKCVKKIVSIDYRKMNRKDRNAIKLKSKADEKRIRTNFEMFNSYVGKDVLYVHARQGGGNRLYYPIDTKHPMYLSDCDDFYDSTYCDIYYDLTKGVKNEQKENNK